MTGRGARGGGPPRGGGPRGGRGGGSGRRPPPPDDPAARERARRLLDESIARGDDPEQAARKALRASDECVEAWLLLADFATSADEARRCVRRAVAASTRVLGEAALRAGRGRLGDVPDGAAHLHALAALARRQIAEGLVEQGVQSLLGVLALDPRDPVQVRGDLLLLLLSQARDDEAEELIAAWPEEAGADWMYGRALLRRRRALDEAALARATEALDRAVARHPEAGRALLARARGGGGPPSPSGVVEEVLAAAWQDTESAVDWLDAALARRPDPEPRDAGGAPHDPEADRRFTAREHVEEAWDAPLDRRAALAESALRVWPDCAEAWRVLATVAPTREDAVARLREAVRAGERAVGRAEGAPSAPLADTEEARALGRARVDLARALRAAGDEEGALGSERSLLADDPDDALGVGVAHAARLLERGRDAEARPLLSAHAEDASPGWSWLRVLALRRAGESVPAAFALSDAMLSASLVGPLLLGAPAEGEGLPENADAWVQARRAAAAQRAAWVATPGALEWLRERLPPRPPSSRERPRRRT